MFTSNYQRDLGSKISAGTASTASYTVFVHGQCSARGLFFRPPRDAGPRAAQDLRDCMQGAQSEATPRGPTVGAQIRKDPRFSDFIEELR